MTRSQPVAAPTYYAHDQEGRKAPLIMSICGDDTGDDPLNGMPQPVLTALDRAIEAARCDGLISYIFDERSDDEMERRSSFLMRQLFDHERTILLVRSASKHAADVFLTHVRKQYTVRPFPARQLATAA